MSKLLNQAQTIFTVAKDTAKTSITAGFGVYGTILDQASKSSDKATQVFESLVERGAQVESNLKEQTSAIFTKKTTSEPVETKLQSITSRFTGGQDSKLSELESKIDQLTVLISELNTAPKKVTKAKVTAEA
ncbi:phasin-related domain-containing protein [Moritella viscosa]|uniref:Phasin domain-containing protein n=1 Tax=Moritella viscosa TaxID=80854 RepID=A0A090IAU6_9GAMM|nr:hypothetical protein [Moritella viscosa]CED58896.1 putative uncharacterized protein [Moritella viscosa]SGY84212.1 Putative uncharacterized protein [Moritella viscosa]SGY85016.1 Putative uncharacterized protein [Moritella viscosa]SGY85120.1 Putative uncharacterized protein [Moritella viscosa]SGY86169.1 Putative uncharacterized protein [Moritella viscosa]